jgi:hypothetical protein
MVTLDDDGESLTVAKADDVLVGDGAGGAGLEGEDVVDAEIVDE